MIEKEFTLYLDGRPGGLAATMTALAEASVNLDGISVASSSDVCLVQAVVSNAKQARKVLDGLGVKYSVQDVSLLPLDNVPGALCKVVTLLTGAAVNLNYVYATGMPAGEASQTYAVIGAPDLDAVERAWKTAAGAAAGKGKQV